MVNERRLLIIDGSYFFYASMASNIKLDYNKLKQKIEIDGPLYKSYFFTANENDDNNKKFYNVLKYFGFIVREYGLKEKYMNNVHCGDCNLNIDLQCPNNNNHKLYIKQQLGVDIGIATMAIKLKENYDTLILGAGDGDFVDMVEYLSEDCNKKIELVLFDYGVSLDLRSYASKIHMIKDWLPDIAKD
jgi:uncharacterized LabA/DUF88 family protein